MSDAGPTFDSMRLISDRMYEIEDDLIHTHRWRLLRRRRLSREYEQMEELYALIAWRPLAATIVLPPRR